jgi:urease accessory protein
MLVYKSLGTLADFNLGNRTLDTLWIAWFETGKKIIHRQTEGGTDVILKLINETSILKSGDVLFEDQSTVIVTDIKPCEVIVIRPDTMYQMAALGYEIGNKHLPLFYEQEEVLVPFEMPLFRLLESTGFKPVKEIRKLLFPLKTTVTPHSTQSNSGSSLFSKIMKLTTPANE